MYGPRPWSFLIMHSCFFWDPAGLFLRLKKISEFFLRLKFFYRKILTIKIIKARFFWHVKKKFQKFLRVKILKPENFWLIKFIYGKIFWVHRCIFIGDSVISVTFFHDRARKFLRLKFYEPYFFICENFLVRFFLHMKINLQFFFSAKLFLPEIFPVENF